jgi:hypothetical protein
MATWVHGGGGGSGGYLKEGGGTAGPPAHHTRRLAVGVRQAPVFTAIEHLMPAPLPFLHDMQPPVE